MISAIISFLGGSVFRMIWGEISSLLTARQNHTQELDRMRLQGELDAAQHARNLESIKLQADLGVKEIRVRSESEIDKIDASGWYDAVRESMRPTGIKLVDGWNGVIRPAAATLALALWAVALYRNGMMMEEWDRELVAAVLGFFFADRTLGKRGK